MKDVVVIARFVFAPNFRKAIAHHYGRTGTATNEEIRQWIVSCVTTAERNIEDDYYSRNEAK